MANPELGGVNRTIDDGNAVVNSGSGVNKQDPDPTSDTEQYVGGVDMSNQKAGSKKKACFQITSVSKRNAAEHDQDGNMDDPDSNDELDESRADEFSSSELVDSFNVSKSSIQDLDPSVDDGSNTSNSAVSAMPVSGTAGEQTNSNNVPSNANQANGNGPHRFKVVKVATEPIRKGRWTCRDFPSETAKSQTTPESLRNQDSSKEMLVHSGNSSAASSVHYIHGQDNSDINPLSQVDESGKPAELGRKVSTNSLKDVRNHSDAGLEDDEKDERLDLDQLKDGLLEHTSESTEGDDGTSPAGGAIDNKIEQAMDLVKSHLLFAVREEVEVLKEQIKILVEKNDKLQEENTTLKQRLQASGAPPQGNPAPGLAMAAAPHQGMPIQPPSQEQPQYPNMPNQMGQNLGQNPMGQALSDHAAYPQHPRPTQQTHSTPNPGGLADANPQYTPQTSVESQGQYHSAHSQLQHIQSGQAQQQQPPQPQQQHLAQGMQDMSQYSQVAATAPQKQTPSQATPQQTQAQYHTSMAPGAAGNRPNTTH